jgi:hypothetical protein
MSKRTKRGIAFSAIIALAAGLAVYLAVPGGTAARTQALSDVGVFRAGSALGEERAGFSGRPQVKVLVSEGAETIVRVSAALQDPAVVNAMAAYTGVLVDAAAEPGVEQVLRERDKLQVVVRSLDGSFLGGLEAVTAPELARLLETISARLGKAAEPSPLLARLRESTEPIDAMLQEGKRAEAEKFADFLREIDGPAADSVQAVENRLGR